MGLIDCRLRFLHGEDSRDFKARNRDNDGGKVDGGKVKATNRDLLLLHPRFKGFKLIGGFFDFVQFGGYVFYFTGIPIFSISSVHISEIPNVQKVSVKVIEEYVVPVVDKIKLGEPGYKEIYYKDKLNLPYLKEIEEVKRKMVKLVNL
ncbi:unnamed protein product [Lactuca virosa]|uniref:Xrn1 helical domain-containing protein n=1 Tax=Lactuca virosa TaxID=75947 RepID=A0AAU9NU41_9ASTR|nr:unnamed protein product [Lactuca virosa]